MVNTMKFLTKDDVRSIHEAVVAEFDGPDTGVRNEQLLDAAAARPRHMAAYQDARVEAVGAKLFEGILQYRPFVDGNKRTALASLSHLLAANGLSFDPDPVEAIRIAGQRSTEATIDWIARSCEPMPAPEEGSDPEPGAAPTP